MDESLKKWYTDSSDGGSIMYRKLKELRKKKKYTTQIMAERLGISKPFYCQIENGTRRLSYRMAVKIADIFNKRPDTLFYEDKKELLEAELKEDEK